MFFFSFFFFLREWMKVLFCDDKRQQVQFAGALTFLATNWVFIISKLLFSCCIYFVCRLSSGHPVASNQGSCCSRNSSSMQVVFWCHCFSIFAFWKFSRTTTFSNLTLKFILSFFARVKPFNTVCEVFYSNILQMFNLGYILNQLYC